MKKTVEIEVKPEPTVEEIQTIEKPGDPEKIKKELKKRTKKKTTKKLLKEKKQLKRNQLKENHLFSKKNH